MDKYVRIRMIGEGSFGKALLVRDKQNNKQYVIKEINMSRMSSKEREEARKEVAVLAQLQHPNIVSYRESFEEHGNLYIAMDYCEAGDLYGKVNSQKTTGRLMDEGQILDWFVQICLSIKHIHDRKILHRDIKTQNIFVTKGGVLKLGDFGIAKVLNSTSELARTCIGTPYYLSPEICENRPYNNKSDIWSLGCVLYELTTLKHAFEAGNMKNLVLKIIRGNYPPIPPKFSHDLRGLVASLFKRNPRDRPSVNAILRKPFIKDRIQRFLNDHEMQSEFAHTVLHGERLQKRIPVDRPVSAPVAKRPTPAPARYDPSNIYRNRVAPRARPQSAAAARPRVAARPSSANANQRVVRQNSKDMAARRQELIDKENRRKQEAAKRQADIAKQAHKRLVEKQKADIIKNGRDHWRNNLLASYGEKDEKLSPRDSESENRSPEVAATPAPRGNYQRYQDMLEQRKNNREAARQAAKGPNFGGGAGARPSAAADPISAARAAADRANANRQVGAESAERARVVEEYKERQRQAMFNKARGQSDIYGIKQLENINKPPSGRPTPRSKSPSAGGGAGEPSVQGRNEEESDYLKRLRQIRLQNFNDRRALQQKQVKEPRASSVARQKKIEALKAQADERARQLKANLEKKRKEALEREQKMWNAARPNDAYKKPESRAVPGAQRAESRAVSAQRPVDMKAGGRAVPIRPIVPAPGLTNVLQAIGGDKPDSPPDSVPQPAAGPSMTNVLSAIGSEQVSAPADKVEVKVRPKWGPPKATPLIPAQERKEEITPRGKWVDGKGLLGNVNLSDLELETTSSQMEATSTDKSDVIPAVIQDNRPNWGKPSSTVVNALQKANVIDGSTVTVEQKSAKQGAGVGVTMSIDKPIVVKKPFITAKPTILKPSTGIGKTITISDKDDTDNKEVPSPVTTPTGLPKDQTGAVLAKEEKPVSATLNLKDTSFPQVSAPRPATLVTPMAADTELEVIDLADMNDNEKKLVSSLEKTQKPFLLKTAGVMIGLTTGNFDAPVRVLRTCSMPDLSKLFATQNQFDEFDGAVSASVTFLNEPENQSTEDGAEMEGVEINELNELGAGGDNLGPGAGGENIDRMEQEDVEMADSDEEDSTMLEVELLNLMLTNDSDSTLDDEDKYQFSDNAPTPGGTPDDLDSVHEDDADDFEKQDAADFESMRQTLQQIMQTEKGKSKADIKKTLNVTINKHTLNEALAQAVPLERSTDTKEAWMSDSDSDSETEASQVVEDDNVFSRLEESRAKLERELGEQTFMKAYKVTQALHEDEDESIAEGSKLVTKILGDDKSHLYDQILKLVVADAIYNDDNL